MTLTVRKYRQGEEERLRGLFLATVRTINARDYTPEQIHVWTRASEDMARWRARMEANDPFVCVDGDEIRGFADVRDDGYIDHFYVHCDWQGKGVGKLLFAEIESVARTWKLVELWSNVSITARPFFASRGFHVVASQEVPLGGEILTNYRMVKTLDENP